MDTKLNIRVTPDGAEEDIEFEGVDYLSFINGSTYGKPPIVAPGTENYQTGPCRVLFVNPDKISAVQVDKVER